MMNENQELKLELSKALEEIEHLKEELEIANERADHFEVEFEYCRLELENRELILNTMGDFLVD